VNGTVIAPGQSVTLTASVTDTNAAGGTGTVAQVEFLANGSVIQTDSIPPYSYTYSPAAGTYQLAARATDSEGAAATSTAVTLEVRNQRPQIASASVTPASTAFSDETLAVTGVSASDPENDPITYAYQWQKSTNGVTYTDDTGSTGATLAAADTRSGALWRCQVTPSDASGPGAAVLTPSVAINRRPPSIGTVGQAFSYDSDLFLRGTETAFTKAAILSEFSQGPSGGTSEWVEFLVLRAGSLRGWKFSDVGGTTVTLAQNAAWDNVPTGTLVVLYNGASKDPLLPADDSAPGADGRMIVSSSDAALCTGTWPSLSNNGDGLILKDAQDQILGQVGYGSNTATAPNVGAVGGGLSANYRGSTESGVTQAANWSVETSTVARSFKVTRAAGDLFISEYVEGTSNNKAIELYNPSSAAVTLATDGYKVEIYANGASSPASTITLTGTVNASGTFVLKHSSASTTITAQQTSGSLTFNGDDAVVLRKGTAIVDVIGQVGFDPGTAWVANGVSTLDRTLRRKATISQGDTVSTDAFDPSVEWATFAVDTFTGLGSHSISGGTDSGILVILVPSSVAENAGSNASTGTVTITPAPTVNTTITLSSSDMTEATVPASVTILASQTTATFAVAAVDDTTNDGPQAVTITATSGTLSGTAILTVTDNETGVAGVTPGNPNGGDNTTFVEQLRSGVLNQPALFRLGATSQTPPGLILDSQSGVLSGSITVAGTYSVVIERYNSLGELATQTIPLTVQPSTSLVSYATWIQGYPSVTQTGGGQNGDLDDATNVLEYFHGTNPSRSETVRAITSEVSGGSLLLHYLKSKTVTGITETVRWSTDLTTWSTTGITFDTDEELGTALRRTARIPLSGRPILFLRLEITLQ
jgi:hypothetical protein